MSTRRTVRKITPQHIEYFDAQYWPVIVALVVLCGITAGAILTLLSGILMWGSLIGLAVAVPVTIFVLERLDNRQLRRALQLAIIISMSVHMLILVVASLTDIFGKERTKITEHTMKRPQRTLLVSQRNQPRIWEKVPQHDVPEPEVEVEKQNTTTQPTPQEIPVKPEPKNVDKQLSKSAQRSQTVPRFDESPSQLASATNSRRQNNSRNMPRTSQQVSTEAAQPSSTASRSEATPNDSVATNKRASESASASSAPAKTSEPKTSAPRVSQSAQRRRSEASANNSSEPSRSTARIRRSTASMPKTSAKAVVKSTQPAASKSTAETAPRDVTEPVTQRERKSIAERRPIQDLPTPRNTSTQSVVKSSARRTQPTPAPPSIAQPSANPVNPRRSRRNAPMTASTQPVEAPSAATSPSESGTSRLQPTAASVTQSRSTAVGSGVSKNVSVNKGSVPSTAVRASDMANRRQSTSSDLTPSLTSMQRSNVRRSTSNHRQVETALKADTTMPSKMVGSSNPASRTATASAATVDSASSAHRSDVSAEKGESQLDIGPTKVVTETTAQKRAGGGQPTLDNLQLEPVAQTRRSTGGRAPTLDADRGAVTAANNQPNSQPTSSDQNTPAESAVAANRSRGTDSLAGEPTETLREGPKSDHIASELEGLLSDNRARRSNNASDAASSEEDEDDEEQRGNARTRLAQAPQTNSRVNFSPDATGGTANSGSSSQSLNADSAEVASEGRGQSNTAPSAGRTLSKSASQVSSVDGGSAQRRSQSGSGSSDSELPATAAASRRSNQRGSGTGLSTRATEIAGGTPKQGQNRQGTQDVAAESVVEVDRGNKMGSIELQVAANPGPAGLDVDPSTRVGVKARPASRESDDLQTDINTRFKRNHSGGQPALARDAVVAKEAFHGRNANQGGGGPQTEQAIELGLEFLARNQQTDGRWTLGEFDKQSTLHQNQLNSDTAATGLAVIAFQGAGYNHREFKYARQLNRAVEWLVANQDADGCLYIKSDSSSDGVCRFYSHAIATLALTEAYGMTQDEKLKKPIEEAIRYIAETQDPEGGGWRYFAELPDRMTDTSVTGWMLMSLQSARLSDFDVPPKVFDRIEDWLDGAQGPDNPSLYRYNPLGKDTAKISRAEGRKVSPTMTSVGLLMRLYMGWDRTDVKFQRGADYLLKHPPSDATITQRDTYYWYYATQVMRHAGGTHWETWNAKLHPLLLNSQKQTGPMAGSWHPYLPIPDRWGHAGGRLYVTTMNLLSLEVNYRLLPLYDETVK